MAGHGPPPKPDARRARRNKGPQVRAIPVSFAEQPSLEELLGEVSPVTGDVWSPHTVAFWEMLGESAATSQLLPSQWALLARAMIHDDLLMQGDTSAAGELRIELSKFFIAPDDMLRGRIQLVAAEDAEEGRKSKQAAPDSRDGSRTRKLRVVS